MSHRGNIKGSVLSSRLSFVRRVLGEPGVVRVLARLPDSTRQTLLRPLLPFMWYPFEVNAQLDAAIAAESGRGDKIFFELGCASANDNLTSASQLQYIREKNPHALLKQSSTIYRVYYDTGRREYLRVSDFCAILRTYDSESFSVANCATNVGWHTRALEMCGGRDVRVSEPRCRARGAALCEYVCDWA